MAAGVVASSAQVYSANVVGYYNVTLPAGQLVATANQLVNSTSNDVATLLAGLPNKTTVDTWTGSGFASTEKLGGAWSPDPVIGNGQGFFIQTPATAGTLSNTFVGSVAVNVGASTTNSLAGGILTLVGSAVPYSTDLNDTNNTLNTSLLPNKTTIDVWNGSGYTTTERLGGSWSPDLTISVGQGFFVQPPATGATWVQTLNP